MNQRDKVREGFAIVEQQIGFTLAEQPLALRDQWGAHLRDAFQTMEVDLSDRKQSNAAWAGAQVTFMSMLSAHGEASQVAGSHLVRFLLDRSEGLPDAGRVSRWLRLRLWLAGKAMPKC